MIGGNGTLRACEMIYKEIRDKKLEIGVCCIPRSIDNDIPIIDKSFGFESGIELAVEFIRSAYFEAKSSEYCVGIVVLPGKRSGFFSLEASLSSRDADICLIPEIQFEFLGSRGLLEYVRGKLVQQKYCILVVSEGALKAISDLDVVLFKYPNIKNLCSDVSLIKRIFQTS